MISKNNKTKNILSNLNNNIIVIFTVQSISNTVIGSFWSSTVWRTTAVRADDEPTKLDGARGRPVAADLGGQEEQDVEADGRQMSVTSGIAMVTR